MIGKIINDSQDVPLCKDKYLSHPPLKYIVAGSVPFRAVSQSNSNMRYFQIKERDKEKREKNAKKKTQKTRR